MNKTTNLDFCIDNIVDCDDSDLLNCYKFIRNRTYILHYSRNIFISKSYILSR